MKQIIHSMLAMLISISLLAQTKQKFDTILKVNGEEMVGTIKEIGKDDVKFVF